MDRESTSGVPPDAAAVCSTELGTRWTNLEQLEELARHVLPAQVFGYYSSGADGEWTLRDNLTSWSRIRLLPRMLVDVSVIDTATTLFGCRLALPVMVAPMALQQMAHPDGELATARAAHASGIGMCVSTMANYGIEEVAAVPGADRLWFQLYVFRDRRVVEGLVRDAEALGYKALLVTVDAPRLGHREADEANSFSVPAGLRMRNAERLARVARRRREDGSVLEAADGSGLAKLFVDQIDASLTWEVIVWLRSITSLPIVVKGVLSPGDAQRALHAGVDGIVVSNHGGRQLDGAPAAVDALPGVVAVVRGRVPVLVDGGVRRGTDVVKALALGAQGVLLGRPVLYSLALRG